MGYQMGFHSHGGTPIAGWFIKEKSQLEIRMRTGGSPISGNQRMVVKLRIQQW